VAMPQFPTLAAADVNQSADERELGDKNKFQHDRKP